MVCRTIALAKDGSLKIMKTLKNGRGIPILILLSGSTTRGRINWDVFVSRWHRRIVQKYWNYEFQVIKTSDLTIIRPVVWHENSN